MYVCRVISLKNMNVLLPQGNPDKFQVLKQFFFIIAVALISLLVFSAIGVRLAVYFYDVDIYSLLSDDYQNATTDIIHALKFMQVFSTVGTFLMPAILFPLYLSKKPIAYLKLDTNISLLLVSQIAFLFVLLFPFLEWLIDLNDRIVFPDFLANLEQIFRAQENKNLVLTNTFLQMNNLHDLITNILVIAFLPALLEEIFFRGLFQGLLQRLMKNGHVAIFIAAIFFSFVHLSFYGFFPRLVLGIVLGYLFYWTGSLWASVFAHFLNNVSAVILVFMSQKGIINFQMDKPMVSSNLVTIISFALAAVFFLYLASYYSKRKDKKKDWVNIFTSTSVAQVEIIKGKLKNNDINAVIINKRDSTYQAFGPVELYVKPEDEAAAKEIIANVEIPDEDNSSNE